MTREADASSKFDPRAIRPLQPSTSSSQLRGHFTFSLFSSAIKSMFSRGGTCWSGAACPAHVPLTRGGGGQLRGITAYLVSHWTFRRVTEKRAGMMNARSSPGSSARAGGGGGPQRLTVYLGVRGLAACLWTGTGGSYVCCGRSRETLDPDSLADGVGIAVCYCGWCLWYCERRHGGVAGSLSLATGSALRIPPELWCNAGRASQTLGRHCTIVVPTSPARMRRLARMLNPQQQHQQPMSRRISPLNKTQDWLLVSLQRSAISGHCVRKTRQCQRFLALPNATTRYSLKSNISLELIGAANVCSYCF